MGNIKTGNKQRTNKAHCLQPSALLLALFFAVATVSGQLFTDDFPSLVQIFPQEYWHFAALVLGLLLTAVFYGLAAKAFALCERRALQTPPLPPPLREQQPWLFKLFPRGGAGRAGVNPLLVYAGIILLLWLPWLVLFLPGNVYSDGFRMIYDAKDPNFQSWHAVFPSLLLATLYDFGHNLGLLFFAEGSWAQNTGVFFIVVLQSVCTLAAYTCLISELSKLGVTRRWCLLTALFFGLAPLFSAFATTVWADAFYLACFVLFMLCYLQIYRSRKNLTVRPLVLIVFLALLLGLLRKEGIYVCLLSLAAFLLITRGSERVKIVVVLISLLTCYLVVTLAGLTSTHTPEGEISEEMLSIPMQQTARTISYFPDDLTPTEAAAINRVFVWDPKTTIAEKYRSLTADPIKGFGQSIPIQDLLDYLNTWAQMGLRHPDVYLDSLLASSYGYYSPLSWRDRQGTGAYEIISFESYHMENVDKVFDFRPFYLFSNEARNFGEDIARAWRNLPVINWFVTPGMFVWLLLFAAALLARARQFSALVVFLPLLLVLMVCIAGPVNGFIRYAAPLLACSPLLLAFTWQTLKSISHR